MEQTASAAVNEYRARFRKPLRDLSPRKSIEGAFRYLKNAWSIKDAGSKHGDIEPLGVIDGNGLLVNSVFVVAACEQARRYCAAIILVRST